MTLNLVTGGAGFVGNYLVEALRARGERVRSYDRTGATHADDIQGDITDPDAVAAAMEGVDRVFHLAGVAHLWSPDENVFERINLGGTKTVLAAARAAGVRRFVQCSSLTTLVSRHAPVGAATADETVELDPGDAIGAYPRSKRLADLEVLRAAADGFDAVVAMPTEPLGAGDVALTPPTRMILDFLNRKTPAYIDCMLNFVPVRSLADGFIAARDHGERGERYLLGGENVPMKRLLATLEDISGVPMPKQRLPYAVALAAGVVDTHVIARLTGKAPKAPLTGVRLAGRRIEFSSAKAASVLGWRASPFEEALRETVNWFRDEGLFRP